MKSVSIIVLNYNSWELTIDFIEKELTKIKLPPKYKIIVVDNCSTNDSYEKLQQWNSKNNSVVLIESSVNGGYAAGNNIGLRWAFKAGYDLAWICNTDILFHDPNVLESMIKVFEVDSNVGVVSPIVYSPNGTEMNRNLYRPSVWDLTFGKIAFRKKGRTINPLLNGLNNTYCYNYRSQGCCMLADLNFLNSIDYMDENTFLYMEEPILAERLMKIGVKEACCFDAKITHNHSTTIASLNKRRKIYDWQHTSEKYYYKQYRDFNSFQSWLCCSFTWLYFFVIMRLKKFN